MKKFIIISLMIFFSSVFIVDLAAQSQVMARMPNDEFKYHSADRNTNIFQPKILLISDIEAKEDTTYHSKVLRVVIQENEEATIKYLYLEKGRIEIYPFRFGKKDDIFTSLLIAQEGDFVDWKIHKYSNRGIRVLIQPLITQK